VLDVHANSHDANAPCRWSVGERSLSSEEIAHNQPAGSREPAGFFLSRVTYGAR